jgi:large subunit ribosomal protein L21
MYAIVQQGGHQYRVSPGDRLVVDRLEAAVGSVVALEPVLLVQGDAGEATVGSPIVDGARVAAIVVNHTKGRKLRVFKYKAKKRYRRTQGHRSHLTELRIDSLLAAGEALPEAPVRIVVEAPEAEGVEEVEVAEAPAAKARTRRGAAKAEAEPVTVEEQAAEEELPSAVTGEAAEVSAKAGGAAAKPRARRGKAAATVADPDAESETTAHAEAESEAKE